MRLILSYLFVSFVTNVAVSQNDFQRVFISSTRPSKENIRINFLDDAGNSGHLPVSIMKGENEGPIFTIVAGIHGFEYPPS